jgi:hypothetical protein
VRASFAYVVWLSAVFGSVGGARGDIAYHFKPGIEGQVRGFCQFVEVVPEYGDKDFKVQLTGSLIGSAPSDDPTSARAYLDKWGVGVLNPSAGKDVGLQGQVQLDGKHGGECLRLEFPAPVRLTLLTFASVSFGEDVELLADGIPIDLHGLFPGTKTIRSISDAQGNWPGTIDFTKALQPTSFATRWEVVVRRSAFGDGIQLENVEVEEVPEPSTILLSSIGLLALGIWSVRRRLGAHVAVS